MTRFDLFLKIHKGLRALLFETGLAVQQTDFADVPNAEPALKMVELVLRLYEHHAFVEDKFILPVLSLHAPLLAQEFEQEHVKDLQLAESLGFRVTDVRAATDDATRRMAGLRLLQSFSDFTAFNLEHMNREERKINAVLWEKHSDKELHAVHEQILQQVPEQDKVVISGWMMRGVSADELAEMLIEIKAVVPPAVFPGMCKLAEEQAGTKRWSAARAMMNNIC